MKIGHVMMVVLFLLLAANFAQAEVPWADSVIHTNPVLPRGLGPEMVSPGYAILPLSDTDQNGQVVSAYTSWMTGRSGEKVYVKFRPGEPVEAIKTGSRTVDGHGCQWLVETWHAKCVVRCGNPTSIDFYVWKRIELQIKTVPGPERIRDVQVPRPYPVPQPYPVYRDRLVYAAQPVWTPTPRSQPYMVGHQGVIGGLLGIGAAYVGRTRISITQNAPVNTTSSAAAAASSSNENVNVNNNTNTNSNSNQMQQQQQVSVTTPAVDP